MNRLLFLCLGLLVFTQLPSAPLPDTSKVKSYSYIARIQLPPSIKGNQIKAYYKGTLLKFEDSWCLVPEDQKCLTFSLIVTPAEIEPVCEGNTTRYLKRNLRADCAWYDLTLEIDPHHKSGYLWHIEKKNLADVPTRLPEHSILLYTNPDYIEAVQQMETEKPAGFSAETMVINFPTIIFKRTIDKEAFEETAVTALLASLDLDTIHSRIQKSSKKDQHIVLSMMSRTL